MTKSQLFRTTPTKELTEKIVQCFGLKNIEDTTNFSKNDIKTLETVKRVEELKLQLSECYIPCKARTYLNDLNEKNVLTILRQCLRCQGYNLTSREKYIKGDKFCIYQIIPYDDKKYIPVHIHEGGQGENLAYQVTFS